ncbi:hypothetical protein EK21DRAFT_75266 [Setomelanomma holmii]|uniref:Uncharacterized protein n=1 Tax=Setomelanomma holmii TaxID=210430 RepID=A0A9P4H149_9PLEO|nr:hypothetical protein EK21DRAFT_75266 [Setomelanomma holmii]
MGLGVSKLAKDHKSPAAGNGSDGRYLVVGLNRRLKYIARYSELAIERVGPAKKVSKNSPASTNITIMAEALARDVQGPEMASNTLTYLETLSLFKKAIGKDEAAYYFDVLDLYLRCVRLLRRIQVHCLVHAPNDYPESVCNRNIGMNAVIIEMFSHVAGCATHHKLMFPDAVNMLRKVMLEEGNVVLAKAKRREMAAQLQHIEPQTDSEPSFENPYEDMFPLEWRQMFSTIVFTDENMNCHMPFSEG